MINSTGYKKTKKLEEETSMYEDAKDDDDLDEIVEDQIAEDSGDLELQNLKKDITSMNQ